MHFYLNVPTVYSRNPTIIKALVQIKYISIIIVNTVNTMNYDTIFLEGKILFLFLNELFYNISSDIDQEFLEFVKIFVPYVIPENNLKPKQMNGRDLKGKDMLVYIKVSINSHRLKTLHLFIKQTRAKCFVNLSSSKKSLPF